MLRYRVELRDPHDSTMAVVEITSASPAAAIHAAYRTIIGWPGCRAVLAQPEAEDSRIDAPWPGHPASLAVAA